jgi:molecular chaperone DnaK (HSP70)
LARRFVIGIDLGTTNTSVARVALDEVPDPLAPPPVELFPIPQLVNPGETREEPLLPSSLYIPGETDFPPGSIELPWGAAPPYVVGELARKRGAENAARLVASAKSWLCHGGVDRTAPLLPAGAPGGVPRISPVEASRQYLAHIRSAWDWKHPETPFDEQKIILTVPASFDAGARELTETAALEAGFRGVVLLEEPQAAFYAWIERHPDWRERVRVGDLILVVDIGGGTTDFSLIAVRDAAGELQLERVAVGEHILLGGDNIDLALARAVEQELESRKIRLDAVQFHALWQQCRAAKEALLDEGNKEAEHPITILGRGTGLVGGTIRAQLRRADLERILLEGFLPAVASDEMPLRPRRSGLQELGLPYAADAAITRHLAKFLRQPGEFLAPTHVLFNGGVLRAPLVRQRILDVLNSWLRQQGKPPVQPLVGEDLMHAVARGAAYYGTAREGRGLRIRGGIPKTYYVGIESAMPAVPGMPAPLKALAVAPFGMEEGSSVRIPQREFGLMVGEPAEFRFFCSASRRSDQPGDLIEETGDGLEELSPVSVTLPDEGSGGGTVPVTFETVVTETGMLQLWCLARDGRRWKLEFNLRQRP